MVRWFILEDEVFFVDYSGKDWIFFNYIYVKKILLKLSEVKYCVKIFFLRIVKKDIKGDIVLEN